MQIKTILNRVQKFKSFVYGAVRWVEGTVVPTLEVELHLRVNRRGGVLRLCSRGRGATIRLLPARRFELVPLWDRKVFFTLAMSVPGKGRVLVVDGGGVAGTTD